jgi:hypothetical protein
MLTLCACWGTNYGSTSFVHGANIQVQFDASFGTWDIVTAADDCVFGVIDSAFGPSKSVDQGGWTVLTESANASRYRNGIIGRGNLNGDGCESSNAAEALVNHDALEVVKCIFGSLLRRGDCARYGW